MIPKTQLHLGMTVYGVSYQYGAQERFVPFTGNVVGFDDDIIVVQAPQPDHQGGPARGLLCLFAVNSDEGGDFTPSYDRTEVFSDKPQAGNALARWKNTPFKKHEVQSQGPQAAQTQK